MDTFDDLPGEYGARVRASAERHRRRRRAFYIDMALLYSAAIVATIALFA